LFASYTFRPFAINLHQDTSMQLIKVLRLVNSDFSFSLGVDALFVNPLVQLLKNVHGALRPIILFPFFYVVDLFHIPINKEVAGFIFILAGFLLTALNYVILKRIIDIKKAFWYTLLISTVPYYIMQVKAAWWSIYFYPIFFAGLYYLNKFLETREKKNFIYFCILSSVLIFSTPTFFFSGIFFILYILVFYYNKFKNWKDTFSTFFKNIIWSPWVLFPITTFIGLLGMGYIGYDRFGGEYGVIAKLFSKTSQIKYYKPDILLHLGSHGLGLLGIVLFPAMIVAAIILFYKIKKTRKNNFLFTSLLYFVLVFILLILVGGGTGARVNELFFPGIILIIYTVGDLNIKKIYKYIVFLFLIICGFLQITLYNIGYTPDNLLTRQGWFPFPRACQSIWCPYHFGFHRDLGIKTLGFVIQDYLDISPMPFISKEDSWLRQKDIVFHTSYGQGPTMHIGRRISKNMKDIVEPPSVIILFTDSYIQKYPDIVKYENHEEVKKYLEENENYKRVASVVDKEEEIIFVYALNSDLEYKEFSVEEYDVLFDKKYASLRELGQIDLGGG